MANIDLGNLTRYDGKIKQYAEDKYLSKNTANWQMTEKAGAVTCYPVPNTELELIVDFSFKEVLPASGDKSPSNPSTIEGVNSINLTRCGKNLMPINTGFEGNAWGNEKDGITWTKISDAIVKGNGTASKITGINLIPRIHLPIGCIYTFSVIDNNTPNGIRGVIWQSGASSAPYDDGYGRTFLKINHDSYDMLPSIYVPENSILTNTIFKVQIELGNYKTEFESPISNTYTYSLGNTYYGGSVNLATGLMTVTVGGSFISTFTSATPYTNVVRFGAMLPYSHYGNTIPLVYNSNRFGFIANDSDVEHWRQTGSAGSYGTSFYINKNRLDISNAVDSSNPTNEEWLTAGRAWLENNPIFVASSLYTPYAVQLTPMQIKSLFALDKNTPRLNTLYTDADSIQVGYQKHPARTAYELENAILALGGGE